MRRILFVDDEPEVLEGLRLRFRKQREIWEMTFAEGAEAGLSALEKADFDAVVSDMRMPGMNGVEFLRQVRKMQPPAVRIALSGQSHSDAILSALSVAHQFLAKPAQAELLTSTLERVWALQDKIHNPLLTSALGNVDQLPAAPKLFAQVTQALERDDADLNRVAELISHDVAMSAKILQVLNSPYFGLQRQLVDIREAVAYLGIDCTQSLLVNFGFQTSQDSHGLPAGFSLGELQRHSLLTAKVVFKLFPEGEESKVAVSAAILHDIGRLAMAHLMPIGYQKVLEHRRSAGVPCWWAEEAVLGFSHAEVGAYLLAMWGIPFAIIEAVVNHHHPERGKSRLTAGGAIYVANRLAEEMDGLPLEEEWDSAFLREVGLEEKLKTIREELGNSSHNGDTTGGSKP